MQEAPIQNPAIKYRNSQLIVVVGRTRVGKTLQTMRQIEDYIQPNQELQKAGRKVLYFDVNGELSNEEIARVNSELASNGSPIRIRFRTQVLKNGGLIAYSKSNQPQVMRIMNTDDIGNPLKPSQTIERLNEILRFYRHGMLVLEDINKYMVSTQSEEIIGALCSNSHLDLDIIIHLHSCSAITTRMWQNLKLIRFHFQQDPVFRYSQRPNNYELLRIAQLLVNKKYFGGDKRFFLWVLAEDNCIKGKYSSADFKDACMEYMLEDKQTMKMNEQRFIGQKDYKKLAQDYTLNNLMRYNGNNQ